MAESLLSSLKTYTSKKLSADLIAGLTVAVMLVPQGMAYALLAGLPPIYGLYAALVPLLIYPFFGSSPYLSVGPVAVVSVIVLSALSTKADPMGSRFIELAIITSIVAGAVQLLLSVLKMGFLVNFLSNPVINGFTSAAAFIIAFSQLKNIMGISVESSAFVPMLYELFQKIDQFHIYTFAIGTAGLAIIMMLKRWYRSLPSALIVVILSIGFVILTRWDQHGVAIVADVPRGLPSFKIPAFHLDDILLITPLALIICLISFIESLAIAKTLGAKYNDFSINANKELMGLGLAKIVGGFFQAYPNTGSFTRSAVNEQAGAKTGLSSIFAAAFIGLTLLFFTQGFYYLPNAILAAIVISSVFGLVDYAEAKHLWHTDKRDFLVLWTTFILTLSLPIQYGVFGGVILSLLLIIHKVSNPHYAILGRMKSGVYRSIERYPDAEEFSDSLIIRYDEDIFFGNAEHFLTAILKEVEMHQPLEYLILDMSSVGGLDSTGIQHLKRLHQLMNQQNITVQLTGLKGPVRDLFEINQLYKVFGKDQCHININAALGKQE